MTLEIICNKTVWYTIQDFYSTDSQDTRPIYSHTTASEKYKPSESKETDLLKRSQHLRHQQPAGGMTKI